MFETNINPRKVQGGLNYPPVPTHQNNEKKCGDNGGSLTKKHPSNACSVHLIVDISKFGVYDIHHDCLECIKYIILISQRVNLMNRKKKARNVNKNARMIVTVATEKGYSYEEIAEICSVSIGSVKRWLTTGRADGNRISAIEDLIGPVHLRPGAVGDN